MLDYGFAGLVGGKIWILGAQSTAYSPRKGKLALYIVKLKPDNYFGLLVSLTSSVTRSFASEKIAPLFVFQGRLRHAKVENRYPPWKGRDYKLEV